MRRFSSYGPINTKRHYYAPREELLERAYIRLVGEYPDEDGHYITVWAPRQCGSTWVMQEAVERIKKTGRYEVGIFTMGRAKKIKKEEGIDKRSREKYEKDYLDESTGVKVIPIFVETG